MDVRVVMVLLGIAVVALADRSPSYVYNDRQDLSEYTVDSREAEYNFNYAVKHDYSGIDFGHQESRDGDHTQGSYTVQLPDGRLQTVTYYVDGDSGYVAEVNYQGEAQFPDSDEVGRYQAPSAPAPRYSTPESDEESEYVPPRGSYVPPRQTIVQHQPSYPRPRPSYSNPEEEESREVEVYVSPPQSYSAPTPEESEEARVYNPPRPKYFLGEEESFEVQEYTPRTQFPAHSFLKSYQPPIYIPTSRSYGTPL